MNSPEKFRSGRYAASKLLDTLLTRELGDLLSSSSDPSDKKISVSG
jgi:hypothetical protein